MANLTPPTSLWTVSTSVNGDTLTWLLPCGITWCVWQEQEFFYLFICHILLQLSHVLDWDTFCCVFSWSQWVKSRHTTILQTPEIPSNAPARWEACWLKCDLSGRLCTSTVNKVGGLEYCAFQEHPYIFTKVNSFPPSTTAAPRTVSLVPAYGCCVGCDGPPDWLAGDVDPPLLHNQEKKEADAVCSGAEEYFILKCRHLHWTIKKKSLKPK